MKNITLKSGKEIELNQAFNMDCFEFMKELPDKCIDLVLTDPPYGIGISGQKENKRGKKSDRKFHEEKEWDNTIPSKEIFEQIFRISKNQIIWGGNYFVKHLSEGHKGWIYWNKGQDGLTMSDGELAYSSFDYPLRSYVLNRVHLMKDGTIHPTQKPLKLFKWCLEKYAPENAIVFDPFLGSFTTAVACHHYKLNWLGCEKDPDYFKSGYARYEQETKQILIEFNV